MPKKNKLETGLTTKQQMAVTLLSTGQDVAEVARVVEVNRVTVYKWLKDVEFKAELNKAAESLTQDLLYVAIGQLENILRTGRNADKIKAIELVLQIHGKIKNGGNNNLNVIQAEKKITVEDILREIEGL